MAAIFLPHGANIPDVYDRYVIAGSACTKKFKNSTFPMPGLRELLRFSNRRNKALSVFLRRSYCQNVASGLKGSDTGFNPSRRALDRADKEFELIGSKATFQGSALKLEDTPKLKLPEVMTCLTFNTSMIRSSSLLYH